MEQGRLKTFRRVKERAGWLEERRGPRLRPPDPPTFECSTSSLVKRSGAVSEASAKGGRRARVGRCVQNSARMQNSTRASWTMQACVPDCDDTPESASTDCVQSELGRGMGGRISDEIMRQKIFCVACEAIDFFSKDRIVSCTKEKNATAV